MLKTAILRQKQNKEQLLTLPYITRAKSKEAEKWLHSNLIKVVIGPRRAGKSVFSLMLLQKQDFAYFNFDDESLGNRVKLDELMKELKAAYGDTKYILFDEIQNLPKWELFVNRLHREGYNLVLTGSNAKLLSKELSTHLTGRHMPIEILPFDFKEFLQAKNYQLDKNKLVLPEEKGGLLHLLESYLQNGSYPELAVSNLDSKGYLSALFDSLLFKDVVKRHRVRFPEQIDKLGVYLINNVASQYSIRKLVNILDFKSGVTLEKYLNYLTEAYIIFFLNRYSPKAQERIRSPRKTYVVDNGFVGAKAVQHSPDIGKLMENLVFTELIKKGSKPNQELFYYKTKNQKEVDFVIKEGLGVKQLIQTSYDMSDKKTAQREIKALVEASNELKCNNLIIISWEQEETANVVGKTIKFIPLWQWLTAN